ncbi:MAG: hypothetical protein V1809_08960 [Planctomycetota bacterium]
MAEFPTLVTLIATGLIVFIMIERAIRHSTFLAETPMQGNLMEGAVTLLGLADDEDPNDHREER